MRRKIVASKVEWEQHFGRRVWWQVPVTTFRLDCGHEKVYRGHSVPKRSVKCAKCGSE